MYNLPGYVIKNTTRIGNSLTLIAEYPQDNPECPTCGNKTASNGTAKINVRDVNLGDDMVGVEIIFRKYACKRCSVYLAQNLPLIHQNHHMTERLVDYIESQCARRPYAVVAQEVGVDQKTAKNIFVAFAQREADIRAFEAPNIMGIDEVRLGDNTFAVIVNIRNGTLVEILPDREEKTVRKFFQELKNPRNVECVAMDDWETYRKVAKETLHHEVRIVLDRFHAVAYAQNAMEAARKYTRAHTGRSNLPLLTHDSEVLLSLPANLQGFEVEALATILDNFPTLKHNYQTLCDFRDIWTADDKFVAGDWIERWISKLAGSPSEKYFKKPRKLLEKWKTEVLNYFYAKESNAMTEAMNRKIVEIFRQGNGLSAEGLRRKAFAAHSEVLKRRRYERANLRPSFNPNVMGLHVSFGGGRVMDYGVALTDVIENFGKEWIFDRPPE